VELAPAVTYVADFEADLLAVYPGLARRLTLIVHDASEAEDIAQAAFARALERRHQFAGGDLRAWLYTIGIRLAFNELRRRRRASLLSTDAEPAWAMDVDPDLWLAIGQLDPQHRAALLLHTLDGYTHEEIGRMLDVRAGTVGSWLSRAKAHLRETLGGVRDE
jgi:RNA polymerase sigma-70 factor (ECF subfamily)